jgi:Flp pilus assembly protein TadD
LDFIMTTLQLAADSSELSQVSPQKLSELESLFRDAAEPTHSTDNRNAALAGARGLAQFPHLYFELSRELSAAGNAQEADEYRKKAIALIDSLESQFAQNPDQLAAAYAAIVPGLIQDGQSQQAATVCRKLLTLPTKDSSVFENTALAMAKVSDRDTALVMELARKAIELNSPSPLPWTLLGHAEYLTGDFSQAVSDLQKSMAVSDQDNTPNLFFLAMAHWKLGEKELARQDYQQAVSWMMQHHQDTPEFLRFRAETEKLMGISTSNPSTTAPSAAQKN